MLILNLALWYGHLKLNARLLDTVIHTILLQDEWGNTLLSNPNPPRRCAVATGGE